MKNKIITYSFVTYLVIFLILNIFISDKEISLVERRHLTKFPHVTTKEILNGNTFHEFEEYTLDQFPFRDKFRSIKTYTELYLFNKSDSNGLFIENDYIYKLDYPLNNKSIDNFINKTNNLINEHLTNNNKIYLSIIPDKNYFLNDDYLTIDYNSLINKVVSSINANYIDIIPYLSINDYYKTDSHWKQEEIVDVANCLAFNMSKDITKNFTINSFSPFYGVYYGQLGLNSNSDKIIYLTNKVIDEATIYNYEDSYNKIYNLSKLKGIDPYDIFLSGATPYIEITNNLNNSKKELIIFRDSFGSSVAPLLLENYTKITLIDMRYINISNLEKLIEFNNQDILFLYSTMLINNSFTLKN